MKPIHSPEYLSLELHLINEHNISASETTELEDLGLEIKHGLLHYDIEANDETSIQSH
jgi:hypothetical protein